MQKKITDLEKEKNTLLANPSSQNEILTVFLYSNEIHNQQIYLTELYQIVANLTTSKNKIDLEMMDINLKLEGIKTTAVIKKPAVPEKNIKPNKSRIIILAFFLGLMASIIGVFIAEFINTLRRQRKLEI